MSARTSARRVAAPLLRPVRRAWIGRRAASWPPYTRLFLVQHSPGWAPLEDARALASLAEPLGIRLGPPGWAGHVGGQSVFHLSQFSLLRGGLRDDEQRNRLATVYLHGRPGTPGYPEFDEIFETLCRRHRQLDRVQICNAAIRDLVLESGIDPAKVFLIRLGVDADRFQPPTQESRQAARRLLDIPESAFAVGSLQKDGVGWGEGLEPKLIKGPDVLVEALARLAPLAPELVVVLTGPARGYVKRRLDTLGIRHLDLGFLSYAELPSVYHALDVCLVSSRQEGGPKSLLEAMASGVPVVTTRVGQAADLVVHGENGFVVEVGDADGLAHWAANVRDAGAALAGVKATGRATAERNSYRSQLPLWRSFMREFVKAT